MHLNYMLGLLLHLSFKLSLVFIQKCNILLILGIISKEYLITDLSVSFIEILSADYISVVALLYSRYIIQFFLSCLIYFFNLVFFHIEMSLCFILFKMVYPVSYRILHPWNTGYILVDT